MYLFYKTCYKYIGFFFYSKVLIVLRFGFFYAPFGGLKFLRAFFLDIETIFFLFFLSTIC